MDLKEIVIIENSLIDLNPDIPIDFTPEPIILHQTHGFILNQWILLQSHWFNSRPMDFTPDPWILLQNHEFYSRPMDFTHGQLILLKNQEFYSIPIDFTPDPLIFFWPLNFTPELLILH